MSTYIDQCISHYQQLIPEMSPEVRDFLAARLQVKTLKAKDFYLKAGEAQPFLGFLVKGLIRSYYLNDDGSETTAWFAYENEYVTDYPNFIRSRPSYYYFQCLEEVSLVLLSFEDMHLGYSRYPVLERYGRLVTEQVVMALQGRVDSFLFQTAAERYLNFIETNPSLFQRISLTDLATYLGVERQSLSRIRKQLSTK